MVGVAKKAGHCSMEWVIVNQNYSSTHISYDQGFLVECRVDGGI